MTQCATNEVKISNIENKSQWELVFERKREEYLENNMELLQNEFKRETGYIESWFDTRLEKEKAIYIENQKDNYRQEYNESMEEALEDTDLSHLLH